MENIIVIKSKAFAIRIVKLSKYLNDNKKRICFVKTNTKKWY